MSNKIKIKLGDLRKLVREAAESLGEAGEFYDRKKEWDEFPDRPARSAAPMAAGKPRATPAEVAAVRALVDNAAKFGGDLVNATLVRTLESQVLGRGEGLGTYGRRTVSKMLFKLGLEDLAYDLGTE